ncbi:hypothetical protein V5O48_003098 [Marasmius crinis-equi]|uniref:Uncharacterized protein n=1 Tax=Marasmius crinis-equi TaxID=585013 RepID=A0ABR3FU66_9AGAR
MSLRLAIARSLKPQRLPASRLRSGKWSDEEDQQLLHGIGKYGDNWSLIATMDALNGASSDTECRKRWHARKLKPVVKRSSIRSRIQVTPNPITPCAEFVHVTPIPIDDNESLAQVQTKAVTATSGMVISSFQARPVPIPDQRTIFSLDLETETSSGSGVLISHSALKIQDPKDGPNIKQTQNNDLHCARCVHFLKECSIYRNSSACRGCRTNCGCSCIKAVEHMLAMDILGLSQQQPNALPDTMFDNDDRKSEHRQRERPHSSCLALSTNDEANGEAAVYIPVSEPQMEQRQGSGEYDTEWGELMYPSDYLDEKIL